jgi:glycosyltransferase involved in cell wall biosynthesis
MTARLPVTVLMSVRNGGPFLAEAVQSILCQTWRHFTFIILDNASTDASRDIIRSMGDSRIRLVALDRDHGQTGALNIGLGMCDTPFVARMDADDVARPQRLARQLHYLDNHPDVELLGSWYEVIDEHATPALVRRFPEAHADVLAYMLYRNPFGHSTVMFSRTAARSCGNYRDNYRYAQDFALWWQMALNHEVAILPEITVGIRAHSGQITRGFGDELAREPYEIVRDVLLDNRLPAYIARHRHRARGYAELRCAAELAIGGNRRKAVLRMIEGLAAAPSLVATQEGAYFAARAALPDKLYSIARAVGHRLGVVSPS